MRSLCYGRGSATIRRPRVWPGNSGPWWVAAGLTAGVRCGGLSPLGDCGPRPDRPYRPIASIGVLPALDWNPREVSGRRTTLESGLEPLDGWTKPRFGPIVGSSRLRRVTIPSPAARGRLDPFVARRSFRTADALIVVCTDGYFDVFPPVDRTPNDKPNYRGVLAELGPTVRGPDDRLSVRPESVALDAAVAAWSRSHGAAAVRGEMGLGRNSTAA